MKFRCRGVAARIVCVCVCVCAVALGTPAYSAISRTEILLDGDPATRAINTEDIVWRRAAPPATTHEFGSAVAFGDINGDGFKDAIVGQRTANAVYVFLGSNNLRATGWYSDPAAADIVITAPEGSAQGVQQFGFSVAAFNLDLDPNGFDEIVVGAPLSDPGGRTDAGIAWVIYGGSALSTGLSFAVDDPSPPTPIVGLNRGGSGTAGDNLGFAVAAGTLAGGSDSWLAVSARGADASVPFARTDAGAIHVVRGSSLPSGSGTIDLLVASMVTLTGSDARDNLGESIAGCDVDGSGDDDLIAGAMFGDGPGNVGINRGEAVILLGENLESGYFAGMVEAQSADLIVYGATDGDDLGFRVACGDLDGDALADIVLSAPFADGPSEARPTAGEVYLLRGRTSAPPAGSPPRQILIDPYSSVAQAPVNLSVATSSGDPALTLHGAGTADQLGFALALGDLDNDGFADLLASARRYDRSAALVNTGAVYILSGGAAVLAPAPSARTIDLMAGTMRDFYPGYNPNTSVVDHRPSAIQGVIVGASKDDHMGFTLAAGDMDGDGLDEALLGAIGDLTREPGFPGEAYLLDYADIDGDGASNLLDLDSDNDGLSDAEELAGDRTGGAPTDPLDPDTDGDQIQDGTELGLTCPGGGGIIVACDDPNQPLTATTITLPFYFIEDNDPATVTSPLDRDSDDDGVDDGIEDFDGDGFEDSGETDADDHDSDADLIFDGTELGLVTPLADTDVGAGHFVADADMGASTTEPGLSDTDGDGIDDGVEDANRNGAVAGDADLDHVVDPLEVWAETDPTDTDTDRDGISDGLEDADHDGQVDAGETRPLDQDSDDDGLPDGWIDGANGAPVDGLKQGVEGEDLDLDGVFDLVGESNPRTPDTDADLVTDGVECGLSGAGATGRNGISDIGPGGDGTDTTSTAYRLDADAGASRTDPTAADTDGDLIADGVEDANRDGAVAGDLDLDNVCDAGEIWLDTDPEDGDTDQDGLLDGLEDADRDGALDAGEANPLDQDTDDDGLPDGWIDGANGALVDGMKQAREGEDLSLNGIYGPGDGEGSPLLADSDRDGLADGTEAGLPVGGGVSGLNGAPDGGPGGDGTDITSPAYLPDADPSTTTEPGDADSDEDGLPDGYIDGHNPNPGMTGGVVDGAASVFEGEDLDLNGAVDAGETNPNLRDSDTDGVKDGAERGVTLADVVLGPDGLIDATMGGVQDGTGGPGVELDTNASSLTDPRDGDTDDDGLSDGTEDTMGNGAVDSGESDPLDPDSDGDLLTDGLERGRTVGVGFDTDLMAGNFTPDADPLTTTSSVDSDTDNGGAQDGAEDADRNGRVDPGERDPNDATDDDRSGALQYLDMAGGTPIPGVQAGSPLFLRLDDDTDEDADPNVAEMVTVACASSDFMDDETIPLTAVAASGGVFEGTINTTTMAGADADGTLSIGSGGSITCTYTDDDDAVDIRVAIAAAAATAPAPLPPVLSITPSGGLSWEMPHGAPAGIGPLVWNLYRGTLSQLRTTGIYTQEAVVCGGSDTSLADSTAPSTGDVLFWIVSAVIDGQESTLGRDSAGRARATTSMCGP